MTHPLTDEMMSKIHGNRPGYSNPYDEDDMRAAADWQLEQCINELNGALSLFELSGKINEAERLSLLNVFKNAMRPQENNS
jgi:hypothetical protein